MDYRRGIDFRDALEYPGFEFVERLHSDMPQEGSRHLAKQCLDNVQPGAMLRRQDVLKTVGVLGEKGLRLFGKVCGMIVQDDPDGAFRGISGVTAVRLEVE
jgi:hypothetical protein